MKRFDAQGRCDGGKTLPAGTLAPSLALIDRQTTQMVIELRRQRRIAHIGGFVESLDVSGPELTGEMVLD